MCFRKQIRFTKEYELGTVFRVGQSRPGFHHYNGPMAAAAVRWVVRPYVFAFSGGHQKQCSKRTRRDFLFLKLFRTSWTMFAQAHYTLVTDLKRPGESEQTSRTVCLITLFMKIAKTIATAACEKFKQIIMFSEQKKTCQAGIWQKWDALQMNEAR